MYRSHSPALSQELLDYIVDFLHNNRRALRTCTLSSKCLLDASRHHLFGTVRVYGKADNDKLQRFISLLCHGSSVKWYIRKLEITSATGLIRHSIFFNLSLDTLQEVLSHIPSLRNLRLKGLRIVCPGHFSLPHTIASGPHLHHVDISNCDFEENVSISFPGLLQIVYPQTLRIYKLLCPLDAPVEAVRQCPSTQHPMTSATLHHDGIQRLEILQILSISMPGDTLFNLVIKFKDVLDPSLMATFGSIIAKHSSSLRRLELIPGDWRGLRCTSTTGGIPWSLLNLSSASKLTFFRLEVRHNLYIVPDNIAWEMYLTLIALLPDSIECIEVTIEMAFRGWDTYPLPSSTGAIQKLRSFPALNILNLSWGVEGNEAYAEELMKRMKALLPELDRRGVLKCSYSLFTIKPEICQV